MYSIFKILVVLKLTLILLLLTAGMGIVSEHTTTKDSTTLDYPLMDHLHSEEKTEVEEVAVSQEGNPDAVNSTKNCTNKNSLGELRLYIEL